MLSRVTNVIDRRSSNRVLTRLRALLRSNEFYLIPLALVVGIVAGAIVTLMSEIAQIAHVLIFGIPIDVRLSANAYVNPVVALIAPASGGLLLGIMEWSRRRMKISSAVDPIEANALRGGRLSLRDSVVVSGQTLISNGCGASVGLEAGYTQIGSGAASLLGQVLNLRRNDLRLIVGCGAAAAIAAAFGAPITGAFYACELIVGVYSVGSAAPILAASLAGALTAQYLGGAPYSLEVPHVGSVGLEQYLALIVLSLITAGIGIAVMRSSSLFERLFVQSWLPVWIRPAIGGVCVGAMAIVTPQVLAAGHGAMVEGQRQRQQAVHRNPVICAHGALAGAADAEDRDLWWHDDEHGVLSADSSEIRQRERRTAQLGGLQAAVLDALLRSFDLPSPSVRRRSRDVAQHRHEQAVRAVDRQAEIDARVVAKR